jgi:hypothetical protein
VDLNEAAQRILRRHWALILLLTVVGLSVPVGLLRMQEPSFEATARIVIGAVDTKSGQEATALADTALALATSPDVLERTVADAHVVRDPALLVEQVQVEPIGTSGVLELSVTDRSSLVSAKIVNSLAEEVVRLRDDAVFAATRAEIATIDGRLAAVTQRLTEIESSASATVARLGTVDALALQHAQAMEERAGLEAQRQQLVQVLTTAVPPRVIDASSTAGTLVQVGRATRLAVGGVLGMLLGVALAAARESLRPTLSGAAIARHLGAPLLARLPQPPRGDRGVSDPWLANYLTLAADATGVTSVQLVPVGPDLDITRLSRDLSRDGGPRVTPLHLAPEGPDDEPLSHPQTRLVGGIVAVTPDVVKGTAVFADLERHAELSRRPIIGVITYRGRLGFRRSRTRAAVRTVEVDAPATATSIA